MFFRENPVWSKILLFSVALFFLRIADGIISFWAPSQIQEALGNSTWMGIVISFQSVIGFLADLFLPGLIRNARVKTLLVWAIILSAATSFAFIGSQYAPFVLLFLIAMAIWGIYYELLHFAQYQFMGASVSPHLRSSAWGILNIFTSISYFFGPLIAAVVLVKGLVVTEVVFMSFLIIGLFLLVSLKVVKDVDGENWGEGHVNAKSELKHWLTLAKVIWPIITINLLLGFIDSTFWTTGAVWTEKLAGESFWGGLFLPFYQLPAIFLGLIIAKWGIYKGKKILAEKFLILAGIFLMLFAVSSNIIWILAMVLAASTAVAICYPLVEGVYTDLVSRMGRDKEDMVGLSGSTLNLAYIIGPPIAGILASQIGERLSFSYLGLLVILVSLGLLFVTPKKLRLPQNEIETWK